MTLFRLASHAVIVMLLMFAVLAASSCEGASGVGLGMNTGPRWGGGGSSGPPIFVGGPVR